MARDSIEKFTNKKKLAPTVWRPKSKFPNKTDFIVAFLLDGVQRGNSNERNN